MSPGKVGTPRTVTQTFTLQAGTRMETLTPPAGLMGADGKPVVELTAGRTPVKIIVAVTPGAGGTFSVAFPNISANMGTLKLEHIQAAKPDILVSPDMSCLMHLGGIAEKQGAPIPMRHLAQVLRDSLKGGRAS